MNSSISYLISLSLAIAPAMAEEVQDQDSSLMAHARKIQAFESALSKGAGCPAALRGVLKDNDPYSRRVAIERCGDQLNTPNESLLAKDNSWIVQDALRTYRVKSRLAKLSPEARWKYFERIARANPQKIPVVAEMFVAHGWAKTVDDVHRRIPEAMNKTARIRDKARAASKLQSLSSSEGIAEALHMLGDPSPAAAEMALHNLVRIGEPALQAALSGLRAATPKGEPPPWTPEHTAFQRRIKLLMALPDVRSVRILEELQSSGSTFVRRESSRALKWVRSGTKYPIEHESVLLLSVDDRSPLMPEADELP